MLLANNISFSSHPLSKFQDAYIKKIYILVVLNYLNVISDEENLFSNLVFAQWLINQSNEQFDIRDLLISSKTINMNLFQDLREFFNEDIKCSLIFDCMFLAVINKQQVLEYLVELILTIGVTKEKLIYICKACKAVLTENFDSYEENELYEVLKFDNVRTYLQDNVKNQVFSRLRTLLCTDFKPEGRNNVTNIFSFTVHHYKHSGDFVNKGDLIIDTDDIYCQEIVRSTCKGVLYFNWNVKPNELYVHHENDDMFEIWLEQKKV